MNQRGLRRRRRKDPRGRASSGGRRCPRRESSRGSSSPFRPPGLLVPPAPVRLLFRVVFLLSPSTVGKGCSHHSGAMRSGPSARATRCMARRQRKFSGGPSGTSVPAPRSARGGETAGAAARARAAAETVRLTPSGRQGPFEPARRDREQATPRVRADGFRRAGGVRIVAAPRRARTRSVKSAMSSPLP